MTNFQFVQTGKAITIDIKPGSDQNPINPRSRGKIPVAILSTSSFDAADVDGASLTFGRIGDEESLAFCHGVNEDVNEDGLPDLLCLFNNQAAGFQNGDTEGFLKGATLDVVRIVGGDSIRIVGKQR